MEERKNKSNVLIIILFILLLIAVGIICYLLGSSSAKESDKNNSTNQTEQKENSETSNDNLNEEEIQINPTAYTPKCVDSFVKSEKVFTDIDETKYNNIIEYIKEQQNVEITLTYCDDNPKTEDLLETTTYKLTNSEMDIVFNEIANSKYNIVLSELGGACVDSLKITYERKNNKYEVFYYQLFAMHSNDGNIYKILDKSVNNTLPEEEREYCGYFFDNLSNTATSIMNKIKSN